jgi:hypothetical protein
VGYLQKLLEIISSVNNTHKLWWQLGFWEKSLRDSSIISPTVLNEFSSFIFVLNAWVLPI